MAATDVVHADLLDETEITELREWAVEIEAWPSGSHVWGHYAEQTPLGPRICRTENVSACHDGIASLVDGPLQACAEAALGEPAVAFKDKLNYKQPGGAGYSTHQDQLAYPGVDRVVSILVAIDDCRVESGCLWLADGVTELLPVDERGVVRAEVASDAHWFPAELTAGDAVLIDGLAPHYSEANDTDVAAPGVHRELRPGPRALRPRRATTASVAIACDATPSATGGSGSAPSPTSRAPRSPTQAPSEHCTH